MAASKSIIFSCVLGLLAIGGSLLFFVPHQSAATASLNLTGTWFDDRERGQYSLYSVFHDSDGSISIDPDPYTGVYITGNFFPDARKAILQFRNPDGSQFWTQEVNFDETGNYGYASHDGAFYTRSDTLLFDQNNTEWAKSFLARLVNLNPSSTCDGDKCLLHPVTGTQYGASQFMRDAYYTYVGAWDLFINKTKFLNGFEYMLLPRASDSALPQYRSATETSYGYQPYCAIAPDTCIMTDSACFATLTVDLLSQHYGQAYYDSKEDVLVKALEANPVDELGFIINNNSATIDYGFHDSVAKNGSLFYGTVLQWMSYKVIYNRTSNSTLRDIMRNRMDTIRDNLDLFWHSGGGYRATYSAAGDSVEGNIFDVWGNALAVAHGCEILNSELYLVPQDKCLAIFGIFVSEKKNIFFQGNVRPVIYPHKWNELIIGQVGNIPGAAFPSHQNGGYWATQLPDVVRMLNMFDPEFAAEIVDRNIGKDKMLGAPEWVSPYQPYYSFRNPGYLASASAAYVSAELVAAVV